jgi:hypothetical protein
MITYMLLFLTAIAVIALAYALWDRAHPKKS